MSKMRLVVSVSAIAALLILAGGGGAWAFPLRAPAQAAKAAGQPEQKEFPPYAFGAIEPVTQVPVVYPPEAKKAGIQGNVKLRVAINKDGGVMDINVRSGPPQLVKAALEAVSQWRYSPAKEVRVTIVTIFFALGWCAAAPLPPPLKPLSAVRPVYPAVAKAAGIQGSVRMRIKVSKDGRVIDFGVLSGPPTLVKAALDAVTQWRYPPMEKVAVTDVALDFRLPKAGEEEPGVAPPMAVYKPEPDYTEEARDAKLEGTVLLSVTVAADGTVTDVKVTRSLGKGLDESAVKRVKTWKFLPATKAGKPVAWTGAIEVAFQMNRP
jgi:TonB family protein